MDILIKSAKIIDANSSFNGKHKDILISNGRIEKIADAIDSENARIIERKDLHLSIGWCDLRANFQDPGYEYKEDLESGMKAAAAGGFTTVALSAATDPVADSKSGVEYIKNNTKGQVVNVLPLGAVSQKMQGKDLADLHDMRMAGAIAFSDDKKSIANPNLLLRALLYCKAFDGLVINFPNTKEISNSGVMNEGNISTILGLKGIPELSEELMVARDIYLSRYTDGRLHFSTISSAESLELIKEAKKEGLKISCDLSSYHLLLEDKDCIDFDTRYKTIPPLRSTASRKALIRGIKDGVIDAICSDHQPEDIEAKKMEFDNAAFGIINLQTAFAVANTALDQKVKLEKIVECLSANPRKILKLKALSIEEGTEANLTLFSPNEEFILEKTDVLSKSANSPFIGRKLKGKVYGVLNNKKMKLF